MIRDCNPCESLSISGANRGLLQKMLSNVMDEEAVDYAHVMEAKEGDYECVVHTYLSIYLILSYII
jgi:hypothetical protein